MLSGNITKVEVIDTMTTSGLQKSVNNFIEKLDADPKDIEIVNIQYQMSAAGNPSAMIVYNISK